MWQRNLDPVKVMQVLLYILGKQEGAKIDCEIVVREKEPGNGEDGIRA